MARRLRRLIAPLAPPAARAAPSAPAGRFGGLDGLRAIAAAAVFLHHVGFWSNATFTSWAGGLLARLDIGVPIFFALSGFLMFRPVAASIIDGTPLRPALDHLWRRALRIYPAFWAALGLIVLLTSEGFRSGAMAVTTAALVHIHHPELVLGPMPHAWSLATEISFYVLLPVMARVLRPLIRSRPCRADRIAALLWCMAGLYLLSVFFRLWMHGLANDWTPAALLWLPAMIDHFAIGMTLAVAHVGFRRGASARARLDRWARPAGLWWLTAAALFVLVSEGLGLARGMESASWPREMVRQGLYGAIGLALLFPLVFGATTGDDGPGGGLVRRVASGRILAGLGRISYSVYLWHMVFIVHLWQPAERAVQRLWDATVRTGWFDDALGWSGLVEPLDSRFATLVVVAGVPTLAVSAASYWLIERPGQAAAGLVRRPVREPTALEAAVERLAERWRGASFQVQLGVLAGLAAAVRLAYVLGAKRNESILEPGSVFPGDQFYYALAGDAIADGRGFVVPWHHLAAGSEAITSAPPAADHPPLTALVASVAGLLPGRPGTHVLGQRLTMAALGVAAVVLVGLLGRAVGGNRAGLAAALLAAVYAGFWVNDGLVMSETLTVLAVSGALLAAVRYRRSPTTPGAVWMGVWVGTAALARSEALLLAPLLVLPAVVAACPDWRARLLRLGAAATATAVLLAPWVIPNLVRFNEPVLMSTNVGRTLAGANNPQAYSDGAIGFWALEHVEEAVDVTGLDQSEASAAYLREAFDYTLDNLDRLPAVVAARVGRVWSVYRPLQMVEWNQGEGRERWASLLALAGYGLLLPAAACGWWILRRSGRRPEAWMLAVPFAQTTLVAAAFYGLVRLRAPAEVALVVLAGVAFARFGPFRRNRDTGNGPAIDGSPPGDAGGAQAAVDDPPTAGQLA